MQMATVSLKLDIGAECAECSADLGLGTTKNGSLTVDPCVTCVSAAREEGRGEGIDEARAKAED